MCIEAGVGGPSVVGILTLQEMAARVAFDNVKWQGTNLTAAALSYLEHPAGRCSVCGSVFFKHYINAGSFGKIGYHVQAVSHTLCRESHLIKDIQCVGLLD